MRDEARDWAWEEFGEAQLGDARRVARLVSMASRAARRPSGLVSDVFSNGAERQGAYDFLESSRIEATPIVDAIGRCAARRCLGEPFVYVPLDGSSLTIVDHARNKGFGHIGTYGQGLRGLKVLTAIAVSSTGTPLGLAHLEWWNRPRYTKFSSYRPPAQRESQKWHDAIMAVLERFKDEAPNERLWFQLDREGDSKTALIPLVESGQWFTVRSQYNRRLEVSGGGSKRQYLRAEMKRRPVVGRHTIDIPRRGTQPARQAQLSVRFGSFTVLTQNKWNRKTVPLRVNVVWAREVSAQRGHEPLDWMLLTNHPVETFEQTLQVIHGYCQRWRIEDFHRTWKSGLCNAEGTQLRGSPQVQKWATILASVAVRAERLKHLARTTPDEPASIELTPSELDALRFFKERQKKSTEILPARMPTIQEAVTWIAEIGGYINRPAQGPPGIKTIQRGMAIILPAAAVFQAMPRPRKIR